MRARNMLSAAAVTALLALLAIGVIELSARSSARPAPARLTLAQMRARLSGSPAGLAALHAQADELLGGGLAAVRARLNALNGTPLVVNKWASWCAPCRAEFGAFASASVSLGREVAFLGIDSGESSRAAGSSFLRAFPVAYPSYFDPSGETGSAVTDSAFTPVTVFYDAHGGEYIHQGPYASAEALVRDVRRDALDA